MRIRSTKPEFWRSERIASVSWDARLVLKGLESYVDDNGVGKDDIALITGDLFQRDLVRDSSRTLARVAASISELNINGLLWRYDVEGTHLLFIAFWDSIQRVDKPLAGRFRRPDGTLHYKDSVIRESVATPRESSRLLAPGTGEQGNRGTGDKDSSSPAAPSMPSDINAKRDAIDAEFEAWWKLYPRRVSKGAALKAYRSARRKTDAATLTAAIRQQSALLTAKGADYCPHGSTWLNAERWTDDLGVAVGGPRLSQTRTQGILPREI